jgi:two-component system, chemotaxis family, chemotaxis protein CheY
MTAPPPPLQGRAFLVVDDEPFVRGLISRFLRALGASVVEEAADGTAAIEILRASEYQFDCVLTDFAMRPGNGLRLLADIRTGAEGLKRNQPVLMLTAHSDAGLVWAAFQLDTNGFLVKPPQKAALADRILRILARPSPVKSADAYREIAAVIAKAHTEPGARAEGDPPPKDPVKVDDPPRVNAGIVTGKPSKPGKAMDSAREPVSGAVDPRPWSALGPERSVALGDVPEGAYLSRSLHATGGGLLLASGTQLSARLIERLRDIKEVDDGIGVLWVCEPIGEGQPPAV